MLSKRRGRTFLKFGLIWTIISALFITAYSTGLYLLYKDGIQRLKRECLMTYNSYFHTYHTRNDLIRLYFAKDCVYYSNYCYFGKVEDDGSLTDVYKTDYDVFQLESPDVMFPGSSFRNEIIVENLLTNDPDKQGKVVSSSQQTAWDEPSLQCYEQHFYSCPENVFSKIRNAQNSGVFSSRTLALNPYYYLETDVSKSIDNDLSNRIKKDMKKATLYVSDFLTHYIDDTSFIDFTDEKISYDGAYINRADVDVEAGKILSGELKINGEKTSFPDKNLTDSNTVIRIILHKRPDSILENNKELLRDVFDDEYLNSLVYKSKADLKEDYEGQFENEKIERFTCDYKYEEGQAVISGVCKYEDGYYRYVYIFPLAGFFEAFAPCILEVMLKIWLPGLIAACLLATAITRKRYG